MKSLVMFAMLSGTLVANQSASANTDKIKKSVLLEGTTFQVVLRGNEARVSPQRIYFAKKLDVAYFKNARKAAEIASGCVAIDDHAWRHKVIVELDCSSKLN